MKKLFNCMLLLSIAGFLGAGCAKDPASEEQGQGQAEFVFDVAGAVAEQATAGQEASRVLGQRELPAVCIPSTQGFSLTIKTAADVFVSSYTHLTDYDQPLMDRGDYKAIFSYGSATAEGRQAYYFTAEMPFRIVARKTISVSAQASLANAAVSLKTTDHFNNYYTSAELTLRTESGYSESFTINKAVGPDGLTPTFVKAGTKLYLSGSAVKTNGVKVSFPETRIDATGTVARTWHAISVDMSSAAQISILIDLDHFPTEIIEKTIELNPEA